jgi:hypothetical protein
MLRVLSPDNSTQSTTATPRLEIRPIGFRDACAFVATHHRHHRPPQGHKFSLAVFADSKLAGVAIIGRPVARRLDDGLTAEVTRLCTDGTKNAASKLYGAARRVAMAMGYRRVITYTLASEPGTSLFAAGWDAVRTTAAQGWSRPSRRRDDRHPITEKVRWEATCGGGGACST